MIVGGRISVPLLQALWISPEDQPAHDAIQQFALPPRRSRKAVFAKVVFGPENKVAKNIEEAADPEELLKSHFQGDEKEEFSGGNSHVEREENGRRARAVGNICRWH